MVDLGVGSEEGDAKQGGQPEVAHLVRVRLTVTLTLTLTLTLNPNPKP